MLFKFCILIKECLYYFKCLFLFFLRHRNRLTTINLFLILFPCLVYATPLERGKVLFESNKCLGMPVYHSRAQELRNASVGALRPLDPSIVSQEGNFVTKGVPESGSGFIESLSLLKFSWDDAGKKSSNQNRENDETEFLKYIHFFIVPLCCIWLLVHCIFFTHNRAAHGLAVGSTALVKTNGICATRLDKAARPSQSGAAWLEDAPQILQKHMNSYQE